MLPLTQALDIAHATRITHPTAETTLSYLAFETRRSSVRRYHPTTIKKNERYRLSSRSALAEAQLRPEDNEQTGLDASKIPEFVVT